MALMTLASTLHALCIYVFPPSAIPWTPGQVNRGALMPEARRRAMGNRRMNRSLFLLIRIFPQLNPFARGLTCRAGL